jgi:hypothetical protein
MDPRQTPLYGQQTQAGSTSTGYQQSMRPPATSTGATTTAAPSGSSLYSPLSSGPQPIGPVFSDEQVKEAIGPADDGLRRFLESYKSEHSAKDAREFVEPLGAHEYSYKDPKHGEGRFVSPMAQEFEKSTIGRHMVVNTPEGKMVDYGNARARGIGFAVDAMLNQRLNETDAKLEKLYAALKRKEGRRG